MGDKSLNISQINVLAEIRNNSNITKPELSIKCDLGKTSIDNIIAYLKKIGTQKKVGSNKTSYWKVNQKNNNKPLLAQNLYQASSIQRSFLLYYHNFIVEPFWPDMSI